ncbi:hypothetical protein ACER0C_013181 [Sarotherodon galilaeus]
MPRKQKKSQAAKQRWKKFHEFHSVPTCEQAECDFPKGSAEDRVSAKTNADGVKQTGQHVPAHVQQVSYADAVKTGLQHEFNEHRVNRRDQPEVSSSPQVGYADIVKRGHHSDVAGRSHSERVNLENQPSVAHVCASHSQAHPKYGDSRNSQCTCNSITFLAFLHENDNMTTADLNLVLDKGDVMYKEAKKRFPKSIHLATDELPDKVDARRSMYHVDMTQPSRYGTFEEPPEEAVDTFLSLEAGLSCLLSDVQYALLIMSGLCIAVFRSTSGKYGFFDPHSRTASGLPLPLWSRDRGTAVMLKFTLLSDMIKRLQDSYEGMEISPSCNYELKPVQFYSMSTVNLSDTITDTLCRPTAATAVAPTHSDTTVDEANSSTPRRNTTTDLTKNIFCQMSICTPLVKQKEVHMTQFTSYEHQNEPPNIPTEELCSELNFLPSNDAFSCQSNAAITNVAACDLSDIVLKKLKKVNKQQRHKMKRRLMASEKPRNQRKENQKRKERQKYASNKDYKEKKKSCTSTAYKNNPEVRQKQQQYVKRRYCENGEFRQKQQQYVKRRYCENGEFRQKQQQYVKRRYCENAEFRQKQQQYVKRRYCENAEFRQKQQQYVKRRYCENAEFRQKQQQYVKRRYCENAKVRQKQKQYIKRRYCENTDFREEKKSYITKRYRENPEFRERQRQLMKQLMRVRYQSNLAFRIMHNMRCAMKIKRKYRWVNRQTQESDNSVINEAISVFKSQIKVGPSYPCTVCFKASFPNQYKDVSIRDDAELCDPTLPDEDEEEEEEDENMNEDDYDEADLMEIDSFLDNTTPESSNVWMASLNDKYKARPETPEYEEMCMADFAATCRIVYGQQTKDHELKTPSLPTYQAFYGAGCVQLPGTDRLEYVQHIVKRNREKYEKNSEEIESAVEEYEQNRDARLKQIKGTRRPFGGMSVIAVGDFYQLPPVRQSKPLCVHDPSEIDLWREHFQMITLTEIMRQKDDVVFAEMLNRIRVKGKLDVLCEADRNLLSQAITEPARCPTDALHIFATNKEVDAHNSATLGLLHTHIIDIHADDYRKDPRTGRMALQDRPFKGGKNELPDTLKVAEGARVMLTRNIDIQNGLVNGAFGKLLRVVYSENDQHIIKLGLKMDNETSGKNNRTPADDMVYIERAEENLKQKGVSIFEPGMAYVAVSRVTSLSGLYLLDMEEKKIFTNPEITAALENMRQANLDDMMPLLHMFCA